MKTTEFLPEITKHLDTEKEVYIIIYERNYNGDVVGKYKIPVSDILAYEQDINILCDKANIIEIPIFK